MRKHLIWLTTAALVAPTSAAFAQQANAPASGAQATPAKTAPAKSGTTDKGATVQGVTVTGGPRDIQTSIDRRSYTLGKDVASSTGSIGDALRNIPSVQVDVQGNISLRGDSNVQILIDGRPSGIFRGEGRAAALQQLPADAFERVEVMTNPSAAFSPEGSAGIINLITKKGRGAGAFGSVRANYGSAGRYDGSVSGNYNSNKWTLSGNLGARHDTASYRVNDTRITPDASGNPTTAHDIIRAHSVNDALNGHAGVDYDPDQKTHFGGELNYMKFGYKAKHSLDAYTRTDAAGDPLEAYVENGHGQFRYDNTELAGHYVRKFAGDEHEFTLDASEDLTNLRNRAFPNYIYTAPAPSEFLQDYGNHTTTWKTDVKSEYKRPLPDEAKMLVGYELQDENNQFDYIGLSGSSASGLTFDPKLNDHFKYDQTVNSLYGTYQHPLGELTVLGGLRLEEVNQDLNQLTQTARSKRDYFEAYPSLHLQYNLDRNQQVTASFSRRVARPTAQQLNPFRVEQGVLNFTEGDPNLRPQFTNSYELGYQFHHYATFYLATLFYREAKGTVTQVVEPLPGGAQLSTYENLGTSRSGGIELVANGPLTKKITYNASATAFWNQIDAGNLGFSGVRSAWTVQGYGNLNWQITSADFLQTNVFMIGKRLTPQGYHDPTGMLNFGYKHQFSKKLSFVATARDVLNTFGDTLVLDTPALKERRKMNYSIRALFVGLTYSFGGQPNNRRAPQREPVFDYGNGQGPGPGGPM